MDIDKPEAAAVAPVPAAVAAPEPDFQIKSNPARITVPQLSFVQMERDARYVPVRVGGRTRIGVTMLEDTQPEKPTVLAKTAAAAAPAAGPAAVAAAASGVDAVSPDEPKPPAAFEFTE